MAEFNAAYEVWDAARFAAAAGLFQQAISNAPATSAYHYWLGTTEFHRMLRLQTDPKSRSQRQAAEDARETSLNALMIAVKHDPKQPESHALIATLYGMKIDNSIFRAAKFGPRLQEHRKKAFESGSTNPRVVYLLGTSQFHTAKKTDAHREALASLLQAEKLFESEAAHAPGPLEPRWGYSSCLTFIGRTYETLNHFAEAETYYRKALALHPSEHEARAGLARVNARK